MAPPARAIRRSQRRSASTIAIFIRTSSVGGTHSIGTESQCSVGQMRRGGRPPHRFSIILISRPVMICPQTRQYRFSSRKCHSQNSSSFLKTCSFSASDNLIEEARSIAKSSFCTKCGTIRRAPDWHISQNRRTRLIRAETSSNPRLTHEAIRRGQRFPSPACCCIWMRSATTFIMVSSIQLHRLKQCWLFVAGDRQAKRRESSPAVS